MNGFEQALQSAKNFLGMGGQPAQNPPVQAPPVGGGYGQILDNFTKGVAGAWNGYIQNYAKPLAFGAPQVQQTISSGVQNTANYFNPADQNKYVDTFFNKASNIPKYQLPQQLPGNFAPLNTNNPILNAGSGILRGVAEGIINIPRDIVTGNARLQQEQLNLLRGRGYNLGNAAAGAGDLTNAGLNLTMLPAGEAIGTQAADNVVKEGAWNAIKKGIQEGATYGAAGGAAQGLGDQYNKKFNLGEVASNTLGGMLFGGIVGGAVSGIGTIKRQTTYSDELIGQLRDAAGRYTFGDTPVKPPKMSQAQWDFQLKGNQILGRNPYQPIFPSDLQTIINKQPVGLSTKNLTEFEHNQNVAKGLGEAPQIPGTSQAGLYDTPLTNRAKEIYKPTDYPGRANSFIMDNGKFISDQYHLESLKPLAKTGSWEEMMNLQKQFINEGNIRHLVTTENVPGRGVVDNFMLELSKQPTTAQMASIEKEFNSIKGSKAITLDITQGNDTKSFVVDNIAELKKITSSLPDKVGEMNKTPISTPKVVQPQKQSLSQPNITQNDIEIEIRRLYDQGKKSGAKWSEKPISSVHSYLEKQAVLNVAVKDYQMRSVAQQPSVQLPPQGGVPEVKPQDFVTEMNKISKMTPEELNTYLADQAKQIMATEPSNLSTTEVKKQADIAQITAEGNQQAFTEPFAKWIGKRDAAETKATMLASDFTKVPGNPEDIIRAIEDRSIKVNPEQSSYIDKLRTTYDSLFADAKKAGIDMKYTKDYLTHIWQEPMGQVQQMYKSLGQKFGFAKDRTLPTYEEGIKMGLTPKFTNPAQILEEYTRKLEQTKANVELFTELKDKGLIVHGSTVRGDPNFAPVQAPGFPAARIKINKGETYVGNWYAPTDIANKINSVFSPQDFGQVGQVAGGLRKASGVIQDVTMSGGLPYTPANAWTFAQATKEMLAGRVLSPLTSFVRSMSEESSNKFFKENAGQIIKMQERNIPVKTSFKINNMIDNGTVAQTFGEKVGKIWNSAVNDPTFQRFSPQLEINLFNDIEKQALNNGMGEKEAADVAAQAVKNFYGVKGTDQAALSNKLWEDFKGGVFFAPKYRQSMVNFWINNLKSLGNPTSLANQTNAKFVVGATLTYLIMNQINKANTGLNMWENPTGKEDKMLIKTKDGYIGVPFLSSIATVPRTLFKMGKDVVQGDLTNAAIEGKGLLSSAVRPPLDVITNQNYYGGNITDPNNPSWGDRALYLAGQYNHPYIQAGLNVAGQNLPKDVKSKLGITSQPEPLYQTASKALEAPFRFYNNKQFANGDSQDALQTAQYFDQRAQLIKKLNPQELAAENSIPKSDPTNPRANMKKYTDLLYYPNVFNFRRDMAIASANGDLTKVDPLYTVPQDVANVYMQYQTLPPGTTKSDMYKRVPAIGQLAQLRSQFFAANPIAGQEPTQSQAPVASARAQALMAAGNFKDPEVQAYLNQNTLYKNSILSQLNMPEIATGGSTNKRYGAKRPTVSIGRSLGKFRMNLNRGRKGIKLSSGKSNLVKLASVKTGMTKGVKLAKSRPQRFKVAKIKSPGLKLAKFKPKFRTA